MLGAWTSHDDGAANKHSVMPSEARTDVPTANRL